MDIFSPCYNYLESQLGKATGFYPYFRVISSSDGPVVTVEGRQVIMLGSNNYLGLTHHPEVVKAAHDAIDRYGSACTGSRFLNGNLDLHQQLEAELAEFTGREEALVFSSGVLANIGTLGLLGGSEGAVLFLASEDHASLFDGARLSHGRIAIFDDMDDLERKLSLRPSWSNAIVAVDGVFSMTGRVIDLHRLVALKRRFGFRLYLDDAHGFGVLGRQGRGTADSLGLTSDIDLLFATFSKALASVGGFVAGDKPVIEYLRHNVRTLIFSAALPPTSTAAALAALHVMQKDPGLFERMWDNVAFFKRGVEALGYHTLGSRTPIVPLWIGSEGRAFQVLPRGVRSRPLHDAGDVPRGAQGPRHHPDQRHAGAHEGAPAGRARHPRAAHHAASAAAAGPRHDPARQGDRHRRMCDEGAGGSGLRQSAVGRSPESSRRASRSNPSEHPLRRA